MRYPQLTNVEKAGILHSWFPDDIQQIIDAISGMSESIIKNEAQEREAWTAGLLNFDFWLQLAKNAQQVIGKYQRKLVTNRRLFTDQLFDGYQAIFTVHCITEYVKSKRLEKRQLFLAVELLFN